MQPPQPRVQFTTEAAGRLRGEVGHRRKRILQAVTAILEDLPREAAGFLAAAPPAGYPSTCFLWSRVFLDEQILWRLDCIVSKTGWPEHLWVIDVFAREVTD
jgi:hypothetical protein